MATWRAFSSAAAKQVRHCVKQSVYKVVLQKSILQTSIRTKNRQLVRYIHNGQE